MIENNGEWEVFEGSRKVKRDSLGRFTAHELPSETAKKLKDEPTKAAKLLTDALNALASDPSDEEAQQTILHIANAQLAKLATSRSKDAFRALEIVCGTISDIFARWRKPSIGVRCQLCGEIFREKVAPIIACSDEVVQRMLEMGALIEVDGKTYAYVDPEGTGVVGSDVAE